ncbi:hypothetical protein PoB_001095500 [Plakobranchus ocellatus]|uniref:Uncharacterized protein n=1 Tax=Plakobranchus ocellatus TaxID=259542 RepID=A0AAV3YP12_9GAST|nr:hypothetical protein PoB_001095500 [Plakobranchus ocellatus]
MGGGKVGPAERVDGKYSVGGGVEMDCLRVCCDVLSSNDNGCVTETTGHIRKKKIKGKNVAGKLRAVVPIHNHRRSKVVLPYFSCPESSEIRACLSSALRVQNHRRYELASTALFATRIIGDTSLPQQRFSRPESSVIRACLKSALRVQNHR